MNKGRLMLYIAVFMVPLILIFSQCFNLHSDKDPRGSAYVGSKTCIQCHKDIYTNYLHTAHFQSVRLADEHTVSGSFKAVSNTFVFNDSLHVVMQKRGKGLYQAAYVNGKQEQAERMDLVFGGIKAETYLYWKENKLYELPLSYFKALHQWTNSPGYDSTHADFSRMIGTRCFECHSSYIKELPQERHSLQLTTAFEKNSLIPNIDCERCHGPAANHVNYHTAYPGLKKGMYIANYSNLSRAQKIDMCAVCHSGNKNYMYKSTFGFKPGDTLAKYKEPDFLNAPVNPTTLDVHGNQTQMLAASACFINSKMDCATCHNTHQTERGNLALYSQRCMQCHTTANHNFCKMAPKLGSAIVNNCIDCHMPAKPSDVIVVQTGGKTHAIPYLVRNHRIAVYPNEVKKTVAYINSVKSNTKSVAAM